MLKLKNMIEKARNKDFITVVVFTAIMLVVGITMMILTATIFSRGSNWDEVGAVVIKLSGKDAIISYEHNSIFFANQIIKGYANNVEVGDIINIRVNPADSSQAVVLRANSLIIVMYILSSIMIAAGVGMPLFYLVKHKRKTAE